MKIIRGFRSTLGELADSIWNVTLVPVLLMAGLLAYFVYLTCTYNVTAVVHTVSNLDSNNQAVVELSLLSDGTCTYRGKVHVTRNSRDWAGSFEKVACAKPDAPKILYMDADSFPNIGRTYGLRK